MFEKSSYSNDQNRGLSVKKEESLWEIIKVVVQALLIAVVVRTLLFQPFNIPSGSLVPTLLVGDYLFVSKYSYGFSKYSIPFSPNIFSGRILGAAPKRGDVAVFKYPVDVSQDYVKRVIGLPGDKIQMIEGELFINGAKVERKLIASESKDVGAGLTDQFATYEETLPNGVKHLIQIKKNDQDPSMNTTPPLVVPADSFFMMGDNRDNSSDSRVWGPVPLENFVGRAEVIFMSYKLQPGHERENLTEPAWQFWRWPSTMRWNRLFTFVR